MSRNDSDRIVYFENVIVDDMAVVKKKEKAQDSSFAEGFGDFGEEAPEETEEEGKAEKKRE